MIAVRLQGARDGKCEGKLAGAQKAFAEVAGGVGGGSSGSCAPAGACNNNHNKTGSRKQEPMELLFTGGSTGRNITW